MFEPGKRVAPPGGWLPVTYHLFEKQSFGWGTVTENKLRYLFNTMGR